MIPERCSHGVPFAVPECRECSIVWHKRCLLRAQEDVLRHTLMLANLEQGSSAAAEHRAAAAIATLESMGYTHTGGVMWRPPLGPRPKFKDD